MSAFRPVPDRFWDKVNKDGPTVRQELGPCWLWTAAAFRVGGHGRINICGKQVRAHRWSWESVNGAVPGGINVLHRCDTPRCVRPDHLFLGTQADNMADMNAKGRQRHPVKLTEEQVAEIRRRYKAGAIRQKDLAIEFCVVRQTIGKVVTGYAWRNVA